MRIYDPEYRRVDGEGHGGGDGNGDGVGDGSGCGDGNGYGRASHRRRGWRARLKIEEHHAHL